MISKWNQRTPSATVDGFAASKVAAVRTKCGLGRVGVEPLGSFAFQVELSRDQRTAHSSRNCSWPVLFNQIDETHRINQINKPSPFPMNNCMVGC